ncbi:Signal transduction histidine kinase [Mariniphaga anaerophila]|uniref:histidine kinase n=1 Tax=Mariniphaga anaerophila TaxID=1484053 RepID=A0A1M4ZST2_9BACT|nr:hybrid sensor histidine kinase/response regulator transcription factor [Mariniphaga anaerophila]SHF21150.1 Signal transduction histidine kinase [Mariniphaga anaerophila]
MHKTSYSTIAIKLTIFLYFLASAVLTTYAVSPYIPKYKDPLSEPWRWIHYKTLDGMGARCMTEAHDGAFWFGTEKGMVCFDGKVWNLEPDSILKGQKILAVFTSKLGDLWAVDNRRIFNLSDGKWRTIFESKDIFFNPQLYSCEFFETSDGSVWIGSLAGLIQIKGNYARLYSNREDIPKFESNIYRWETLLIPSALDIQSLDITGMCQVSDSTLWIGNADGKLYQCIFRDETIQEWKNAPLGYSAGANPKLKIFEDQLFVVTSSRHSPVMCFDLKKNKWKTHSLDEYFEWDSNENVSVFVTTDDKIWVGGFGRIFSYDGKNWREYQHPQYKIPASRVNFFNDSKGQMWIIGFQNDVLSIDYSGSRFQSFDGLNFQFESSEGDSWFITYEGNIVRYSPETEEWISFGKEDGIINFPVRLFQDISGRVWTIGSHDNVAATGWYDKKEWLLRTHPKLCWSICETGIMEESDGTLWFGALGSEAGSPCQGLSLIRYFPSKGQPDDNKSWELMPGPGVVFGIGKDANKSVYIGSYMGLSKYVSGQFINANEVLGVEYPKIDYIGGDENEIWIAVRGQGAFLMNENSTRQFQVEDGLASNTITDILFADRNDIWFGTDRGISRYHTELDTWIPHAISGKLIIKRESGNLKKSSSGKIWINQNFREWKKFFHSRIPNNKHKELFYTIRYLPDTLPPETVVKTLPKTISSGDDIFVVWDGIDPWNHTPNEELLFSYKMDNGEWSPFSTQKNQLFSSLKPGKHQFSVRACDGDFNVDPTPFTFPIEVVPPVYRQLWFVLLISLLSLTILIQVYWLMLSRQKRLKSELALSVTEAENARTINEMKIRFFTNISHEIRTPLTLILDPVRKLISQKKYDLFLLQMVEQNASRLQRMINQILDFRKIETGNTECIPVFGDIMQTAKEVFSSFLLQAEKKKINYSMHQQEDEIYTWFDVDKLDKILTNLVSNAIKYTPVGGNVSFQINFSPRTKSDCFDTIIFYIRDTGIGISKENQTKIFERYFQASVGSQNIETGTGIGLSFTRDLVNTCGGHISFESYQGEGTIFKVELPVGLHSEDPLKEKNRKENRLSLKNVKSILTVLVVEDNTDLLNYLGQVLSGEGFKVLLAENGVIGFNMASSQLPDLIISDVMMPEMDGLQFTKKIKNEENTSHIPIILLTARKSEFQHLEGLKAGADDYITKPFSSEIVVEKIKNIFRSRDNLVRRFKEKYTVLPAEISKNSKDRIFVDKFVSIMLEHLSESDFKTDDLCREIGMSRTLLYAKIKSITGMAVNEFIQTIKLKEAARLIIMGDKTITEVMYDVGYNNIGHFRKLFKKQYKVSPREFKNSSI